MPISAAGNSASLRFAIAAHRDRSGFTLLELLVVIAIIAIATAGVGLALRDSGQATLDREAVRLAALFESARAQSRASGVPVRWYPTKDGFVFAGVAPNTLPTYWLAGGMHAQPATANNVAVDALQLGPDPIIAAQQVLLTMDGPPQRSLVIATDGLRPFAVTTP
jgi:general secretion pathway protein H